MPGLCPMVRSQSTCLWAGPAEERHRHLETRHRGKSLQHSSARSWCARKVRRWQGSMSEEGKQKRECSVCGSSSPGHRHSSGQARATAASPPPSVPPSIRPFLSPPSVLSPRFPPSLLFSPPLHYSCLPSCLPSFLSLPLSSLPLSLSFLSFLFSFFFYSFLPFFLFPFFPHPSFLPSFSPFDIPSATCALYFQHEIRGICVDSVKLCLIIGGNGE